MSILSNNKKFLSACFLLFLMHGCKQGPTDDKLPGFIESTNEYFDLTVGKVRLQVEVAALPREREKGLMFRQSMDDSKGMIFIFKNGTKQRFWMKNTRIPLDIGYFSSNGSLVEIHKAKPHDLSGVPSRSRDVQFVLELNKDAYKKLGIQLGDRIDLKLISEILRKRRLQPSDYNLP